MVQVDDVMAGDVDDVNMVIAGQRPADGVSAAWSRNHI